MSLKAFIEAAGSSFEEVATKLDIRIELFERVEQGRQPLPVDVAAEVAVVTGTNVNELLASAFLNTEATGPQARRPLPPLLGEPVRPVRYAKTQPVIP